MKETYKLSSGKIMLEKLGHITSLIKLLIKCAASRLETVNIFKLRTIIIVNTYIKQDIPEYDKRGSSLFKIQSPC